MSPQRSRHYLTPEEIAKILRLHFTAGVRQADLARRFSLSTSYVSALIAKAKREANQSESCP